MSKIRTLTVEDIDSLLKIERDSLASAPWSRQSYLNEFSNTSIFRGYGVLDLSEKLIGFIIARVVLDEADISNIAVTKAYQGQGYAFQLLQTLLKNFREEGGRLVTLEVREHNYPARKLYEKCGFKQVSTRQGYYKQELAILMNLEFGV